MFTIFGRHHIRATFYHGVAIIFLIGTTLWYFDILSDKGSFILTAILFVVDYLAEMYDPHPDNPGPWFKSHFHRAYDNDDCDEEECLFQKLLDRNDKEAKEFFKKHCDK
jgi:hypothetical protein